MIHRFLAYLFIDNSSPPLLLIFFHFHAFVSFFISIKQLHSQRSHVVSFFFLNVFSYGCFCSRKRILLFYFFLHFSRERTREYPRKTTQWRGVTDKCAGNWKRRKSISAQWGGGKQGSQKSTSKLHWEWLFIDGYIEDSQNYVNPGRKQGGNKADVASSWLKS